jgi:hypothetical protein
MRSILRNALLIICTLSFASSSAFACDADLASSNWQGDFAGADTNDFGLILRSAQVGSCAQTAHDKLLSKLNSMSPSLWSTSEWSGVPLSMVLATGLILGGNGHLSDALDMKLAEAANNYNLKKQAGCGFTSTTWQAGNTCLEDYAIDTAGQGWRTAYYRLTGRDWTGARTSTVSAIRNVLSDSTNCIYDSRLPFDANRGPCNSNLAALDADTSGMIEMMTLNHGYQNPAYGLGMLTHMATGYVGLEVAQKKITASDIYGTYPVMAKYLYREGNSKATPSGAFGQNCRQLIGSTLTSQTIGCWDPQGGKTQSTGYRADMFPIAAWFDSYNYSRSLAPGQPVIWTFQTFNASTFSDPLGMWGAGRKEAYYTMANQWLNSVGNKPPFHSRGLYKGGFKFNAYYVVNSGTGTPSATSTVNPRESAANLTIQDLNGGDLMDGDPVAIRNKDGFYWQATNGGGSTLNAPSQGIPPNAIFHIEKISAPNNTPVAHNDYFALMTPGGYYFVTAVDGGAVSANGIGNGFDQQFRLERFKTD